jgi:hypothetical protein
MSSRLENRVVLGSLRYKSAPNINLLFQVPLVQTVKENIEFDRTISFDLQQLYEDERQRSTIFRPIAKLSLLFDNKYSGVTSYYPYKSSLYYDNVQSLVNNLCTLNSVSLYSGYPQYYEFDFMRIDNDISGYTIPDVTNKIHQNFVNKSASTYNWSIYLSYAYENVYNKNMYYFDVDSNTALTWVASDGIPFVVYKSDDQNQTVISFRCPVPHGLSVGEYVKLSINYNNIDTFQVYSIGDPFFGSDEYIFNIYDVGFTGTIFNSGNTGTFKRVIDIDISGETTSEYYVRRNKILTNYDDVVLGKSGFEQQIFNNDKKNEKGVYTPNNQSRISIKNGSTVYTTSFNEDIDIAPLIDNHKRPLTELFYTIIWKGYMGWTFGLPRPGGGYYGLKQGWEFNIQPLSTNPDAPNDWWKNSNNNSNASPFIANYTTALGIPGKPFTYVQPLTKNQVIDGDYCEWNNYEQKERVISEMYHKFRFNPYYFNIGVTPDSNPFGDNCKGYYYKPHYPITIRVFSNYIEEGDAQNVVGIPNYAYYSTNSEKFIWRDLYPYGYIDTENLGVNYPYLNNAHYPYRDIIFRLISEGSTYNYGIINDTVVAEPTVDDCE